MQMFIELTKDSKFRKLYFESLKEHLADCSASLDQIRIQGPHGENLAINWLEEAIDYAFSKPESDFYTEGVRRFSFSNPQICLL